MLKKFANGEYSLKVTFWLFGILGFLLFNIITRLTRASVLHMMCYGKICSHSIILFILTNFPNIMMGKMNTQMQTALIIHIFISAFFGVFMILLLRGIWKSGVNYSGAKFWVWCAKLIVVCLTIMGIQLII